KEVSGAIVGALVIDALCLVEEGTAAKRALCGGLIQNLCIGLLRLFVLLSLVKNLCASLGFFRGKFGVLRGELQAGEGSLGLLDARREGPAREDRPVCCGGALLVALLPPKLGQAEKERGPLGGAGRGLEVGG